MMQILTKKPKESNEEYFVRLMHMEVDRVEHLTIQKKESNVKISEPEYFSRCLQAEKEQVDEEKWFLEDINKIAIELVKNNIDLFIARNDVEKTLKEDNNATAIRKNNQYYFKIISVERIVKRNNMSEFKEYVIEINSIVYEDKKLNAFIVSYLKQRYRTYYENYDLRDDYIDSAHAEFLEHICRYNGKYDITTFAKTHVISGITNFIKDNKGMSAHYNEQLNKITKEVNRLIDLGYSEDEATSVSRLMECESLKDLSPATISATLKQKQASKAISYDADYQTNLNEKFPSPEDEVLKQENINILNKICAGLKPSQRFLLYACNGELDIKMTDAEIGYNEELISNLKKEGMFNVIKKDPEGKEFIRKDMVSNLYQITIRDARVLFDVNYADKEKEKIDRDLSKYGSSVINKNYSLLSEEDENIIFDMNV